MPRQSERACLEPTANKVATPVSTSTCTTSPLVVLPVKNAPAWGLNAIPSGKKVLPGIVYVSCLIFIGSCLVQASKKQSTSTKEASMYLIFMALSNNYN